MPISAVPIDAEGAHPLRDVGENLIRPGLPEPIGCGLGVIAKSLFAVAHAFFRLPQDKQILSEFGIDLAQIAIGALQRGAHAVERFDHLVQFIGFARWPAVQLERRRRPRQIVAADKPCDGDQMPGDQPMKHVDDEERHEKRLGRLARQNDQSAVEQLSINLGKRRLDIEDADLALAALYDVFERIFPRHD